MLLDDIKHGDLVIFSDGGQALIEDADRYDNRLYIIFDRKVLGHHSRSRSWNYFFNGKYVGGGTDIVKVIHKDGE